MIEHCGELVVGREEGLAILRLNRPERLNAMSPAILQGMACEIPRLISDPEVRAIMITGTGRGFCAGGDVGGMTGPAGDGESILAGMRASHAWLAALRASDKLVVTAVNGVCAGGGFGLAMIGDLVVASDAAVFKAAFSSLGLAADFGLGFTLQRAVGSVRAAEILFHDQPVSADTAVEIGMINRVLPAATFAEDAVEYCRSVARMSRGAQLSKRLLRFEERNALAVYLEAEAHAQLAAFQSRDFVAGVTAFKEKRPPRFEGR